jgi:hypothetical protein
VNDVEIFIDHAVAREACLGFSAAGFTRNFSDTRDGVRHLIFVSREKSRDAIANEFRHAASASRDNGGATGQGFHHDVGAWFIPVNRREKRICAAEKLEFRVVADFAYPLDVAPEMRSYFAIEEFAISRFVRDISGDLERMAGSFCDADCGIDTFVGSQATDER